MGVGMTEITDEKKIEPPLTQEKKEKLLFITEWYDGSIDIKMCGNWKISKVEV